MLSVLTVNNAVGTDDSSSLDTGVPSVSSRPRTVLDWSIHRGCLALVYVLIHLNLHCVSFDFSLWPMLLDCI